ISALLLESSIVMIDGDPAWPDLEWQWRLAAETGATFMGASPAYVMACRKAGLAPGREHDLSALRTFCTAGAPLPADAYRGVYAGVWRQGDWARVSPEGTWVITGRSDATLNRGGVRLGTGEFYSVVEELPEVLDSLVVHLEDDVGGPGELLLFVVLADGTRL